jgi:hypothetical protein
MVPSLEVDGIVSVAGKVIVVLTIPVLVVLAYPIFSFVDSTVPFV